jgi:hypothetical protein
VGILALQEIGHNQAKHLITDMLEPVICLFIWRGGEADRQWRGAGEGGHQGNGTELFIIRARILLGILEDVRRAGGETTVREDARLDLRRVDVWEGWETTGTEVGPELKRRKHGRSGRGRPASAELGLR